MVIANWVLHFIDEREQYLKNIRQSLAINGVLILTEKISQTDLAQSLYYDFKRSNGVTEDEIQLKQERLKGALNSYSISWYMNILQRIGFHQIDIINADNDFVTFVAQTGNI